MTKIELMKILEEQFKEQYQVHEDKEDLLVIEPKEDFNEVKFDDLQEDWVCTSNEFMSESVYQFEGFEFVVLPYWED